jgi:hypothetical protein
MAIFGWVDKVFGDTNLAQRVILTGSGLPLALVFARNTVPYRSEEHTSELQSRSSMT